MAFHIAPPYSELPLGRFGGLYTEGDPRDLPPGASPLNHDVDYFIGGITMRPGLTSALAITGGASCTYLKSTTLTPALSPPTDVTLYQASSGILGQLGGGLSGAFVPKIPGDSPVISNAIATSENVGNQEFIGLSNFGPEVVTASGGNAGLVINGYDQPRTWNGVNVGRVSQAGPSATIGAVGAGSGSGELAGGPRYCIVMFLMEDGFITPASPPAQFTTVYTDTQIDFSGIQTGPANVVGRIIALTAANAGIGGPYFYVPEAISPYSSTVINDNSSTTLNAVLSDTIITTGIPVTVTGNNVLQMREVGEYVKAVQFAGRMFYMGERVKVDNLPGMTFDGGSVVTAYPWAVTTPNSTVALVRSIIYGDSLSFHNNTGSTINTNPASPTDFIYRNCSLDAFGVATLQNNLDYSVRITAYTDTAGAGCSAGLSLSNGLFPHTATVTTGPLGKAVTEYILDFDLSTLLASGSVLSVFPVNLPASGTFYVDRIEIFPTEDPIYSSQLSASYIGNPQAVDSQTGVLDVSFLTNEPITNEFVFANANSLYITTDSHLFSTQDSAGSEPSGWALTQISDAVGSLGPLAVDSGEAFVIIASRLGAYIFDGGNPVKISQEIQQLWEEMYWPSARRVWVKIDKYQQRFLIGVPMVTPNQWMPDAPANATPSTPNVILMCSYLGLPNASAIADSAGVHTSAFTGMILSRDFTRKWTAWTIASPTAEWILQSNNSDQLWLGGTGTGEIYYLDATNNTDNGAAIPERYITYPFSDEMNNQGLQLGSVRKMWAYMSATLEGAGNVLITTYPETLSTPYADTQPGFTLSNPALDDVNVPLNETGNFMFLEFKVDGVAGSYFRLRRLAMGVIRDQRIPVSGR